MRETIPTVPAAAILKICLTAFLGAHIEYVTDEMGNEEKCVCIPIARNGLRVGSTGKVSCYAFVNKGGNANMFGWTHYLRLKWSTQTARRMAGEGRVSPYIGNMKPSNYIKYQGNYQKEVAADKKRINAKEYFGNDTE